MGSAIQLYVQVGHAVNMDGVERLRLTLQTVKWRFQPQIPAES